MIKEKKTNKTQNLPFAKKEWTQDRMFFWAWIAASIWTIFSFTILVPEMNEVVMQWLPIHPIILVLIMFPMYRFGMSCINKLEKQNEKNA